MSRSLRPAGRRRTVQLGRRRDRARSHRRVATGGYRQLTGCTQLPSVRRADPQSRAQWCRRRRERSCTCREPCTPRQAGSTSMASPMTRSASTEASSPRTVVFRPGNGGAPAGVTAGGGFDRYVVLKAFVNANLRVVDVGVVRRRPGVPRPRARPRSPTGTGTSNDRDDRHRRGGALRRKDVT